MQGDGHVEPDPSRPVGQALPGQQFLVTAEQWQGQILHQPDTGESIGTSTLHRYINPIQLRVQVY